MSAAIPRVGDDSEAPTPVSRTTDEGQRSARKLWSDAVGEMEGQTQAREGAGGVDERREERLMEVYDAHTGRGGRKKKKNSQPHEWKPPRCRERFHFR